MADNLDASIRVIATNASEDFMMREAILLLYLGTLWSPRSNKGIIILIWMSNMTLNSIESSSISYLIVADWH